MSTQNEVDVVVIGAGIAGIYMLHKLKELGLSAKAYEAGDDVGGTWYWNRYPGARCDFQSIEYCYSFSPELNQDWDWTDHYPSQPEMLRYLQFVVDRLDLRRYIAFKTRVTSMVYDDARNRWLVGTDTNESVTARFCITAVGCISLPVVPDFPGVETFPAKNAYHTGRWPHEAVDFSGQRVGVIGTGSSGMQVVPELAKQAAELFVFQRTPTHAFQAVNYPLAEGDSDRVKQRYDQLWKKWLKTSFGMSLSVASKSTFDVTEQERETVYQNCWNLGGFEFLGAFDDLLVDQEANDTAADFLRRKVRQIVTDPAVAEQLVPAAHPLGTRRPCVADGYYEAFNRPNVHLVSAQTEPIEEIERSGVRTSKELYQLDSLVFATGFGALTGALGAMDIRGRGGRSLRDDWGKAVGAYLGVAVAGFPNLFVITGPGSPSVIANVVRSIEQHVEWISDCLAFMSEKDIEVVEPTEEAQTAWMDLVNRVASMTLTGKSEALFSGADAEGKPRQFLSFIGPGPYQTHIDRVANNDYEGFVMSPGPGPGCPNMMS